MEAYPQAYSEESFWSKLGRVGRKAGREVVERALVLYYCLRDAETPGWARGVIVGALGYFVLPMDVIPDVIPISGYSDDFSVLVAALVTVAHHIKPEHRLLARRSLVRWFGQPTETD